MPRDFRLYLDDMLESINRTLAYSAGAACEDLLNDKMRLERHCSQS
jgi:uncharacterized protein with HEPN domain